MITIAVTKAPTVKVVYKIRGVDGVQEKTVELNPAALATDLGPTLQRARAANPANSHSPADSSRVARCTPGTVPSPAVSVAWGSTRKWGPKWRFMSPSLPRRT